jgi:hypothetical protein
MELVWSVRGRKEGGGRRKEEGGRRKEEGGRRKEEGGRRKEEGGGMKREGGRKIAPVPSGWEDISIPVVYNHYSFIPHGDLRKGRRNLGRRRRGVGIRRGRGGGRVKEKTERKRRKEEEGERRKEGGKRKEGEEEHLLFGEDISISVVYDHQSLIPHGAAIWGGRGGGRKEEGGGRIKEKGARRKKEEGGRRVPSLWGGHFHFYRP